MKQQEQENVGDDSPLVHEAARDGGEVEGKALPRRSRSGWGAITPHGPAPQQVGRSARRKPDAPLTFRCVPYDCTLSVTTCLLRVLQPNNQRFSCRSCEVGEAHRKGSRVKYDKHGKPTVVRTGETPEHWADGSPVVRLVVVQHVSDRSDER